MRVSSRQHLEMKSDTPLKYSWLGCEGYKSVTSLFVVKSISLNVNSTRMAGKKGFGLSGLSRLIGSSLVVMSGDDDSAIFE
nr:hypothetical protein [Tanacetum cinerariifolium]